MIYKDIEDGRYKSDTEGMLLTDGMAYGIAFDIPDNRDISEFTEISKEEYEKMLEADAEVIQGGY